MHRTFPMALAAAGALASFPTSASDFEPEIELVMQAQAQAKKHIAERSVSGYWSAGHDHGGDRRGLSLGHSELILAANPDPGWRGVARFALTPEGRVEVEEASLSTLGLDHGLSVRGGRFASAIGYQNAQHRHEWDFADATLMQQVLFGSDGYRHDGVQLTWAAPTDFSLQLGAELGHRTIFAKLGGAAGVAHTWQAGMSVLNARPARRGGQHFEDVNGDEAEGVFSGKRRIAIADFVWKWEPDGAAKAQSLKLQTEVFRLQEDGALSCLSAVGGSPCPAALGDLRNRQSGGYAQAVWQFMPGWRVGYRYDWLDRGSKSFDAPRVFAALDPGSSYFAGYKPQRDSVMVDWNASELSRLRLQYARDRSMQGVTDNQITLQYIISLDAHGAHE